MSFLYGICFILVIIAFLIFINLFQSTHIFVCGNCGKEFKPKWFQLFGTIHVVDEHLIVCPHCKVKNMCKDTGKH